MRVGFCLRITGVKLNVPFLESDYYPITCIPHLEMLHLTFQFSIVSFQLLLMAGTCFNEALQ
jgi:hypothetical protein